MNDEELQKAIEIIVRLEKLRGELMLIEKKEKQSQELCSSPNGVSNGVSDSTS